MCTIALACGTWDRSTRTISRQVQILTTLQHSDLRSPYTSSSPAANPFGLPSPPQLCTTFSTLWKDVRLRGRETTLIIHHCLTHIDASRRAGIQARWDGDAGRPGARACRIWYSPRKRDVCNWNADTTWIRDSGAKDCIIGFGYIPPTERLRPAACRAAVGPLSSETLVRRRGDNGEERVCFGRRMSG